MGNAITDIIDEIEFMKDVVVVVLDLCRRTWFIGESPQKDSARQTIVSIRV